MDSDVVDLKDFEKNFLRACHVLNQLDSALMWIGMSEQLEPLRRAVVEHGANTFKDMNRDN